MCERKSKGGELTGEDGPRDLVKGLDTGLEKKRKEGQGIGEGLGK